MVTAEKSLNLSWDAFVEEDGREHILPQIERFRQIIWPDLRRRLLKEHDWEVSENTEPHWTEPGTAVLWRRNKPIGMSAEQEAEWEKKAKWLPTAPQPFNTASIIAHHLDKGFRLRPPLDGVEDDVMKVVEAAIQPEEPIEVKESDFVCRRHGRKVYAYDTWKAYREHCRNFREPPEDIIPPEEAERLSQYRYACYAHGFGTNRAKLARDHIKQELRRPGRSAHIPLNQMKQEPPKEQARKD